MSNFQDIFMDASNAANSHVCVGLDPDPELMPVSDIYEFCVSVSYTHLTLPTTPYV